jgi:hypothetical protein
MRQLDDSRAFPVPFCRATAVSRQILSMRKIDKRFTGVHALRKVDFDLEESGVHRP